MYTINSEVLIFMFEHVIVHWRANFFQYFASLFGIFVIIVIHYA